MVGDSARAMKNETRRFQSPGGWVALAFLSFAAACGGDDDGTTPTPDATADTVVDTAPPRMDVGTEAGAPDTRADATDSTTGTDARDAGTDASTDRVPTDVPTGDVTSDGDAGNIDVAPDVPLTPPMAFTITGISGPMDTTPDAWLTGATTTPTVTWQAATGALGYEVTVYEDDGTTVKCAMQ